MSLLLNVIFSSHARSTHHKLALDALKHLEGADTARWSNVLISEYVAYLQGSKAPDNDFRDFRNHVLHVKENFWGGAVTAAQHWYGQFIDHLRAEQWKDAAYAAGVLSHYYSDPQMPFHTGQSESEGAVHRAAEWSVTKSYDLLRDIIENELGGYPDVSVPETEDWLAEMVKDGAIRSNQSYDLLIDHYNLKLGVKDPPAGLDRVAQEAVARCLAHATIGFARILERAFAESAMAPPEVELSMKAVVATMNVPIRKVMNGLADAKDRRIVEAIYQEVQETGKAIDSLPDSEKLVRQFHAAEVRKVSLPVLDAEKARPAGGKFIPGDSAAKPRAPGIEQKPETTPKAAPEFRPAGESVDNRSAFAAAPESSRRSRPLRYYLSKEAPIVDAPSIGPKTASRFHRIGLTTVDDLLKANPTEAAGKLETRHITPDVIREWQAQSLLMLNVPGLRGHDAQLLVAAKILDRSALSQSNSKELLDAVICVADSTQGRSILRDSAPPDMEEVKGWIAAASQVSNPSELKAG